MKQPLLWLIFCFAFLSAVGCDIGPSEAELKRERDARIEAEERAEAERQRREEESQKHEAEKSRLWMYIFGVAVVAIVLLFVGAALGSTARKDAERLVKSNGNRTSTTRQL